MYLNIAYFADSADGLCCQLRKACPKEPDVVPFKDIEVERGSLRMHTKLGAGMFGEVWKGKICQLGKISSNVKIRFSFWAI